MNIKTTGNHRHPPARVQGGRDHLESRKIR